MRAIALVAMHVFRDSVRDKVLYSIVAFAVLLMAASFLIGQLTAGQDVKIIKDLGLAAMSLFGLFIADLHRRRPGVARDRAAQHLRGAGQAGAAGTSSSSASISAWSARCWSTSP